MLMGMRRFLTLRWLGIHAAMIVIVTSFLLLGWWQWRRAEGGNALSWGYTFEWPLFAGFVVVFWLRTMRDELRETAEGEKATAAPEVTLPAGIRAPGEAGRGGTGHSGAEPNGGAPNGASTVDAAAGSAGPGRESDDEDAELAAYNAYLARLNAEATRTGGWIAQRGSRRREAGWAGAARGSGGQAADRAAARPGDTAGDRPSNTVGGSPAAGPKDMEV